VLSPSPAVRIFLGLAPVDMRGGHNSLSGVVRRLGLDPLDGHLYVFLNQRRFMAALLWYDGSGWCVLKKRLSKGTFQALDAPPGSTRLPIDAATLSALLQGVELRAPRRRWYRRPAPARP
jgi:transposase